MTNRLLAWAPALLMGAGAVLTLGGGAAETMPLRAPLGQTVPMQIGSLEATDMAIDDAEAEVAGFDDYLLRVYRDPATQTEGSNQWFQVYVGYYGTQMQGRTIHSPRNCMPGAGWEALTRSFATVPTAQGEVPVNRYILKRGSEQVLVLYWYQGRGRVQASEYAVKWDLLRDAALTRRSDEALVRIVVPIQEGEEAAFAIAERAAGEVIPGVGSALSPWAGRSLASTAPEGADSQG